MNSNDDRTHTGTSNIVLLEHVNVTIPDQRVATLFYVSGLGFTRDPYLMVGVENMWINIGRSQMHLPTSRPQRLRGVIGLVVPDLAQLEQRLQRVAPDLEGTRFGFADRGSFVSATCPWGNRFRCHAPAPEFARHRARHALRRVRSPARQRKGYRPLLHRNPGRAGGARRA